MKRLILPVYFDKEPDLYDWLRRQAFEHRKDMTEIVRELIRQSKQQNEVQK